MNTTTERIWHTIEAAKTDRRNLINKGYKVSLIAGDYRDGMDVFVFDVYDYSAN